METLRKESEVEDSGPWFCWIICIMTSGDATILAKEA